MDNVWPLLAAAIGIINSLGELVLAVTAIQSAVWAVYHLLGRLFDDDLTEGRSPR